VVKVDAHQHFWQLERGDYGWLNADQGEIFRDFLPPDILSLLQQGGVDKTILVQAAPTIAETEFLLELAEQHDFIAGVVGWVDMTAPSATTDIKRLATNPWLKSIRPMIQNIDDDRWMLKPELAPAFESLLEQQLCFDALVLPQHLKNLLTLAKRYPQLPIVIDHGAKPEIRNAIFHDWAKDIAAFAGQTNNSCKLSGLLTEAGDDISFEAIRPYMQHLLDNFGPQRLLWGSDWPVLNLASDYLQWLTYSEQFLSPLSKSKKTQIFGGNAINFYKL